MTKRSLLLHIAFQNPKIIMKQVRQNTNDFRGMITQFINLLPTNCLNSSQSLCCLTILLLGTCTKNCAPAVAVRFSRWVFQIWYQRPLDCFLCWKIKQIMTFRVFSFPTQAFLIASIFESHAAVRMLISHLCMQRSATDRFEIVEATDLTE